MELHIGLEVLSTVKLWGEFDVISIIKSLRMETVSAFTILPRIYSIMTGLNSHKSYVFADALFIKHAHIHRSVSKA